MAKAKPKPKKKAVAKKAISKEAVSKKATSKKKPAARAEALDPSRKWSLEQAEKHLPAVSEEEIERLRAAVSRATADADLIALGAGYRTEDILASAPPFVVGSVLALKILGRRPEGMPRALLPLVVREARNLDRMNALYEQEQRDSSTSISGLRAELKLANAKALRRRRLVAQTLLRYVLPTDSPKRAEMEKASAGAKTWAETVASVNAVARVLAELRKDSALTAILDDYEYTEATVDELRALAADVKRLSSQGATLKPPQETNQRRLDRQDGLVLTLMRAVWDPLRDAKQDGAAIELPPTGSVDRFFNPPASSGESEDVTPEPTDSASQSDASTT